MSKKGKRRKNGKHIAQGIALAASILDLLIHLIDLIDKIMN